MESIDEAINYEEEYLKYLPGAKKNGNSLIAKCPFHDDRSTNHRLAILVDDLSGHRRVLCRSRSYPHREEEQH